MENDQKFDVNEANQWFSQLNTSIDALHLWLLSRDMIKANDVFVKNSKSRLILMMYYFGTNFASINKKDMAFESLTLEYEKFQTNRSAVVLHYTIVNANKLNTPRGLVYEVGMLNRLVCFPPQ